VIKELLELDVLINVTICATYVYNSQYLVDNDLLSRLSNYL